MSDSSPGSLDRELLSLALPTLVALLAEPLLLATDAALVGHLGTPQLAGLSLASTILSTLVGLCIFLAYTTTATTSRLFGVGKEREGLRHGIDGLYLAGILGIILFILLQISASPLISLFQDDPLTRSFAVSYLRASAFGLPGMLIVLAATGVLRGMANTSTPARVATVGALINIPLNAILIYPAHLGVLGAGLGTALIQTLMALALARTIFRQARRHHVSLKLRGAGILSSIRKGIPLIVRTASLRLAILVQTAAASALSVEILAANHIAMTMWNFAAYGLDALAIAAQILIGRELGKGEADEARALADQCVTRSLKWGAILAVALFFASFAIPYIMSSDETVRHLALIALILCAFALPLASATYMLDGILIGAGDTKVLALYMCIALGVFTPLALIVSLAPFHTLGFLALWLCYAGVFMSIRAGTMLRRLRSNKWIVLGDGLDDDGKR